MTRRDDVLVRKLGRGAMGGEREEAHLGRYVEGAVWDMEVPYDEDEESHRGSTSSDRSDRLPPCGTVRNQNRNRNRNRDRYRYRIGSMGSVAAGCCPALGSAVGSMPDSSTWAGGDGGFLFFLEGRQHRQVSFW